mmetsp:Transcript_6914/g.18596  ORF Transcript_6914/g.18596 Transcript_6914/m.18596 type:complete len:254 (-) Transcript_6914:224-985(-)
MDLLHEAGLAKGQLAGAELFRHGPVHVPHAPVPALLPDLEQELFGFPGVRGGYLALDHVHHPHEERHAVVSAPELKLALLALQLVEEGPDRALGAALGLLPGSSVQVELLQPPLGLMLVGEGPVGLPLLQLAAFKQVLLDGVPLLPHPLVDVLQGPLPSAVRVIELQRVEIHDRQAAAQDVDGVQVVDRPEPRVAARLLDLHGVVHEVRADHLQRAHVGRIVGEVRSKLRDDNGGVDDALHLLLGDSSTTDLQ